MKISICFILLLISTIASADTSPKCPGEEGYFYTNYRHTNNPQNGGFVSYTATIEDTTFIVIGKMAAVCGNAIILERANISGNVTVRGNAEVSGTSIITGDVILEGDVVVKGGSVIKGKGFLSTGVFENARHEVTLPANYLLAEKISKYFSSGKLNLREPDGDFVSQSIEFLGDPCIDSVRLKTSHREGLSIQYFTFKSATRFEYYGGNPYFTLPSLNLYVTVRGTFFNPDGSIYSEGNYNNANIDVSNKEQYDLLVPMFDELIKACKM